MRVSSNSCPGSTSTFLSWKSAGVPTGTAAEVTGSTFVSREGSAPSSSVGLPSGSTPRSPLKPNMWSNDRFSSIRTNTCSIAGRGRSRPPKRRERSRHRLRSAQRIQSQAVQTSSMTQPQATHTALTTQANALQTHFATQYQALQTHLATQYHARQKKPAMQFQGVYQWHSSHDVHWFKPSSAHCEHWSEPSSAQVVHS